MSTRSHDFENGKYTLTQADDGTVTALRYGEPWREFIGDSFIFLLVHEFFDLLEHRPCAHEAWEIIGDIGRRCADCREQLPEQRIMLRHPDGTRKSNEQILAEAAEILNGGPKDPSREMVEVVNSLLFKYDHNLEFGVREFAAELAAEGYHKAGGTS